MKHIDFAKKVGITLICFLLSQRIYSQDVSSNTQGFSVSLFGVASNVSSNSYYLEGIIDSNPFGVGLGANLGYGFTESVKAFVGFQVSNYNPNGSRDKNSLDAFEFGLKYNFLASLNKIRPFISGAVNWNVLDVFPVDYIYETGEVLEDVKVNAKGLGFDVGVGIQYFLSPEFNLNISVGGKFGTFSKVYSNGVREKFEEAVDFRYLGGRIGATYSFY